jgi:hypothetical protein
MELPAIFGSGVPTDSPDQLIKCRK